MLIVYVLSDPLVYWTIYSLFSNSRMRIKKKAKKWTKNILIKLGEIDKCPKCGGEGWLWWKELDEYTGPGLETGQDDTQYTCDKCFGEGVVPKNNSSIIGE